MNTKLKSQEARTRRVARVRSRVQGTAVRPRLAVARTLKHVYAQLIDDVSGTTLAAASDRDVADKKAIKPLEIATEVGKILAERATKKSITSAVFDRRDKRYHGRVKALAEGARAGGLQF